LKVICSIQIEPRRLTGRHTGTHFLDGISWGMSAIHMEPGVTGTHFLDGFHGGMSPFKWSPGGAQPLTSWKGFHGGMSAIQMEPRRCTATHCLDGFMGHVAIQMEPRRCTATHSLDGIS